MEVEEAQGRGTLTLQTTVAMVLALIVYVVVAVLAGTLFYLIQTGFTVIRPGITQFFSVIIGSAIGMMAARKACDKVLRNYAGRAVFIMFAALAAGIAFIEVVYVPMQWNQINSAAQVITAIVVSYTLFWKGEVA
jgi:hypothetical protein